MKYILDTSAIIVLIEICGLEDQLREFSKENELSVPPKVVEEYLRRSRIDRSAFTSLFKVLNVELEQKLLPYFDFDSSSGEIWVISRGFSHSDFCCVIDEEFGRSICMFFNIKLTGSIGIIDELKKQGFLTNSDLKEIRKRIRNSKFYLSEELLKKLDAICL